MRFETGLKRKPPEGELPLILIGRKGWDFSKSLGKTPRTRVFPELILKSHLFSSCQNQKQLSFRLFSLQPCLKSHLFIMSRKNKQKRLLMSQSNNYLEKGNLLYILLLWYRVLQLKLYLKSTPILFRANIAKNKNCRTLEM